MPEPTGSTPRSTAYEPVWRTLAFFMLPNLTLFLVNHLSWGSRPGLFDLDYALVPPIYAGLCRWSVNFARLAAIILTAVLLALDIFSTFTQIYFAGPAMLLDYLPFASLWPWRWIGAIGLGTGIVATIVTLAMLRSAIRVRTVIPTVFTLVACLFVVDRLTTRLPNGVDLPNIASSGVIEVLHPSIAQILDEMQQQTIMLRPITTPTLASLLESRARIPDRILSVSVESWGRLRDGTADAAMIAPLIAGLADRYVVEQKGLHPFYGATLAGEVRELCALRLTGGVPRGARQYEQLRHCLPARLTKLGYRVVALHGNAGSFYRRNHFYPMMGFAEHWHYEQMRPLVPKLCNYLFAGICDRDVARIAVKVFDSTPRAFVHLMTLDTHLPLPREDACITDPEPDMCTYRLSIFRTLTSLNTAVLLSRTPPDLIILYGDHSPPFVDGNIRAQFVKARVPFLVLRRRI